MYAQIKNAIWGALPVGWDAAQIILGFVVLLIALLVFRRPLRTWWAVLPVVIAGLLIEAADMILLGQSLGSAARDLVLFVVLPLILVAVYRLGWAR